MKVSVGKMLTIAILAAALSAVAPAQGLCETDAGGVKALEHTVVKGDNLMLLAGYYFKDPRQWRRIYDGNRTVLGDPNLLLPGTILKVRSRKVVEWDISYEEFARLAGH